MVKALHAPSNLVLFSPDQLKAAYNQGVGRLLFKIY